MTSSVFLWLLFFHCSKSNEEEDFRKATQLYENTVGVTVDTRHIELKGEPKVKHLKWLTSDFAGCQFRGIGLDVGKERYFSLVSRGFQFLQWVEKLKSFLSSPVLWDHLAATSYSLFSFHPRMLRYSSFVISSKSCYREVREEKTTLVFDIRSSAFTQAQRWSHTILSHTFDKADKTEIDLLFCGSVW